MRSHHLGSAKIRERIAVVEYRNELRRNRGTDLTAVLGNEHYIAELLCQKKKYLAIRCLLNCDVFKAKTTFFITLME